MANYVFVANLSLIIHRSRPLRLSISAPVSSREFIAMLW
uniref:Uncharacterized protein n=1 Tax=Parascaris equorum TaxID=6256 RepID=A0A914RRX2_PAREQ